MPQKRVCRKLLIMNKTILYFHGFKSSSNSKKAHNLKKFITNSSKNTSIIIPDLNDGFHKADAQINNLIESCETDLVFMGSSLGGYYALYYAQQLSAKAVLINPAIPPLIGFDKNLGENENYSTGNKFTINEEDISFLKSLSHKKLLHPNKVMVLVESGDEILAFDQTIAYFNGAHIDITFGGDHSYQSLPNKFIKIKKFLSFS